jgi:hypothetical protein
MDDATRTASEEKAVIEVWDEMSGIAGMGGASSAARERLVALLTTPRKEPGILSPRPRSVLRRD